METGTAVGWRLALWGVVALLVAAGFIGTACPPAPAPDYADSLAVVRHRYAADSAAWRVTVAGLERVADSALRVSQTAKAEAARLRSARRRDLIVLRADTTGFVEAPTMADTVVSLASYDSLAAEADSLWSVVRADSVVIASISRRIAVDSAAYASLASLLADERTQFGNERSQLRKMVTKARRGCRVLGLLPCPTLSAGYGATLTGGQVRTGPVLAVTIPVRLR